MTATERALHVRHLPIAVRTYVPPVKPRRPRRLRSGPDLTLVFDTETTIDASQRLLFGSYRVYRTDRLIEEGLIHADGDVAVREQLERYAAEHDDDRGGHLRVVSRQDFAQKLLWRIGYIDRARIVGFNLPFDLSRLAIGVRPARNGGFSLAFFESVDQAGRHWRDLWRPEIRIKAAGSKRQFMSFTAPARLDADLRVDGRPYRGRFLDLHTLAYGFTDRGLRLDRAAAEFGLTEAKSETEHLGVVTEQYIDYNRQDVRTTWALHQALAAEMDRHPIELSPEQVFSPAAVSKAYLRAAGIEAPLSRPTELTETDHGIAMAAYAGGRAEVRIRRVPVPVRYVDFTSMYPTVFSLLGLWSTVIARSFRRTEVTESARSWLALVDRDSLHDRVAWPFMAATYCRVRPDGDLLPIRAAYTSSDGLPTGAWTMGLNQLSADTDLWYALPDLVVAKLLGGRTPDVLEAVRFEPVGRLPKLRRVRLRGDLEVSPRTTNLFQVAIEARQKIRHDAEREPSEQKRLAQFLKTFGNGGAYGIFAEYHQLEPVGGQGAAVSAWGLWPISTRVRTPEEPGEFCLPAVASSVTAGARLLLALLQAEVEAAGGTYVACDTDSLLIASAGVAGVSPCPGGPEALPDGGQGLALVSWEAVDRILASLNTLNPYDRHAVPALVKIEDENYDAVTGKPVDLVALAISAKRYALYERTAEGPRFRKCLTHGLGLYRAPIPNPLGWAKTWPSWVEVIWDRMVREVEGLPLPDEPEWFDLPAVGQMTTSTPRLLHAFREYNRDLEYGEQVKPFSFLLVGHVDPTAAGGSGANRSVVPVAPFTSDPGKVLLQPWFDKLDGSPIAVTTKPNGAPGKVRLRTYRDVYVDYRFHTESKSGDPSGGPGRRTSVGLLPRLHVAAAGAPRHIGKESNQLDDVEEGAVVDPEDVYVEYRDERQEWEASLPALRRLRDERGWRALAEVSGLSERAVRYALNGGKVPRPEARRRLAALTAAPATTPGPDAKARAR
jgi:hypothetical protein